MPLISLRRADVTQGQWSLLHAREPVVLFSGGYGSGKTTGLGLKLLQLKALNPNVPGMLVSQTWRALWSTSYRRLMNFLRRSLPRHLMPVVKDRQGECYLDFGDGIPVYLRSAHDPGSYDGLDVGWALGDEPRYWNKLAHEVLLGRVRMKCELPQTCYASTPSMNWLYDEFCSGKDQRLLIRAPTLENLKNLSPNYIENLKLSYSIRMQQAVLEGHFVALQGSVYESIDLYSDNSPWVIDYQPLAFKERKTYLAIDPGFRRSAWLWIHQESPVSWVLFDELMADDMTDEQCINIVNSKPYLPDEIWCDPAADNTQSAIGLDTLMMFKKIKTRTREPVRVLSGSFRDIEFGVDKLRTMLGTNDEMFKQPIRLRFSKKLRELEYNKPRGILRDLTAYRYPEEKSGHALSDVPLKDGVTDHSCDALRYWSVGMWLTSPLRNIDKDLKNYNGLGYRKAA